VEAGWAGSDMSASVVGIGINVKRAAVPEASELTFPATSLEAESDRVVDQAEVLGNLVAGLLQWRRRIGEPDFLRAWEEALAFREQKVVVGGDGAPQLQGTLAGLEPDGSLRILTAEGPQIVHVGEIHLRPLDDRIS
jgi:BirA family biotin operon repressor/biotin-[acetyl-CoA-carboxylase] ligase